MIDESTKIAYAEIFEILGYMDRNIVMKIPIDIIEIFEQNKKENYESKIDYNDIFNKKNITKKTLNILAWLNLNYFSTPEEKSKLIEQYRKNDYIAEREKREKYNPDDLFKNKNLKLEKTIAMVEYKESIFTKIKNWFKRTF